MSCGHCRASIEQALGKVPGVGQISIDPTARTAHVEGGALPAALIAVLDQIGFPAQIAG